MEVRPNVIWVKFFPGLEMLRPGRVYWVRMYHEEHGERIVAAEWINAHRMFRGCNDSLVTHIAELKKPEGPDAIPESR